MPRGKVLKSNVNDPRLNQPVEADADDPASPSERMAATPGEPAVSKVPSITQRMVHDENNQEEGVAQAP